MSAAAPSTGSVPSLATGAASGVGLCARLGQYAVLAAAGLQLAAWLLMIEPGRPA